MRFQTIQPDNPILRAEITYQRRAIPRWLHWFDRFGVIILALIISLHLMYFPFKNIHFNNGSTGRELLALVLPLLWIAQLIVIFRSLLAGMSVMHHYQSQQWDVLVLSGVTTQQVLIGKFWSALYQLRGWIVAFGIVKLVVVVVVTTNTILYCYIPPITFAYMRSNPSYGQHWLSICNPRLTTNERTILVVAFTVVTVSLEVMASIAIGIMGGMISQRVIGFILAVFCRLAPIGLFSVYPDYPNAYGKIYWRWFEYTSFSFADGGSTGILRSADYFRYYRETNAITQSVLLAFGAAIVMFMAYLMFALVVSHLLLRRQGVLSASSK